MAHQENVRREGVQRNVCIIMSIDVGGRSPLYTGSAILATENLLWATRPWYAIGATGASMRLWCHSHGHSEEAVLE
jgi:hypothetical protein